MDVLERTPARHPCVHERTRSGASYDHFLGHSPPLPFISLYAKPSLFPICTHTPTLAPAHTFSQPPTTLHHRIVGVPPSPLCRTPPFIFILFLFFLSLQPIFPLSPIFIVTSSPWVPLHTWIAFMLVVPSFAGGWIAIQSGFATLGFGSAHQVLDKRFELVCIMPRARVSSSQFSPARATTLILRSTRDMCFCIQVWGYDMPTSTHWKQ